VTQAIGALVLLPVFADIPLGVRVILSLIGVMFIVAGFPALAAMVAEVVPANIRGLALDQRIPERADCGAFAVVDRHPDQFEYVYKGRRSAPGTFAIVIPLVFVGSVVCCRPPVRRGRRRTRRSRTRDHPLVRAARPSVQTSPRPAGRARATWTALITALTPWPPRPAPWWGCLPSHGAPGQLRSPPGLRSAR
jgi:hypothetical protein